MKNTTGYLLLAIVLLVSGSLMAYRAADPMDGYHGFNEGFYSLIAHNYRDNSILYPTPYEGRTDYNIPPLYTQLLHAVSKSVGESEGNSRGVSIFFSLLSVLAVFLIGRRIYGIRAGLVAAALLAFCPLFIVPGRNIQPDSTFIAFMLLGALSYMNFSEKGGTGRLVLTGLMLGAAMLSKQFGAFVFPVLLLCELIDGGGIRGVFRKLVPAALTAAVLPASYYLYHYSHSAYELVGSQTRGVILKAAMPDAMTTVNIFNELFFGVSPLLFIVFAAALVYSIILLLLGRKEHIFGIAGAMVFIGFFLAVTNHTYYTMGAYPFLALLAGGMLAGRGRVRIPAVLVIVVCVITAAFSSLVILGNLKYGWHRPSRACNYVTNTAGEPGTLVIISDRARSNWPMIMYYCRGIEVKKEEDFGDGQETVIRRGNGYDRIFIVDYVVPQDIQVQGPYVKIIDKTVFGVSGFGYSFCTVPYRGRAFVPGRFMIGKSGRFLEFGMVEMQREPSMVVREVPPGYVIRKTPGGMYIVRE